MGQNLILNMNDHGFVVCAYNRTPEKVRSFLANEANGTNVNKPLAICLHMTSTFVLCIFIGCRSEIFGRDGGQVKKAKEGHADGQGRIGGGRLHSEVDPVVEQRRHHHRWREQRASGESGICFSLISNPFNWFDFQDTTRRCKDLQKKGILYVGSGVSGGEEGARYGPSLMPGGNSAAWPHIKDIFQVCPISRVFFNLSKTIFNFYRQFALNVRKTVAAIGSATREPDIL